MIRSCAVVFAVAACGCAPVEEEPAEFDVPAESFEDEVDAALAAEIEQDFAAYVQALVEDDVAAVEGLVSREVLGRSAQRDIPFPTFVEKQRHALQTTFSLDDGVVPTFEVSDLTVEGDAVRVVFSRDGEDLPKPFWYVFEGGAPKLNVMRPGFSLAAPVGAEFGRESYLIQNDEWYGNAPTTMSCNGGQRTVNPRSSGSVSCIDSCGWWAGTMFQEMYAYNNVIRWCDWNAFGADVVVDEYLLGWYCVDLC